MYLNIPRTKYGASGVSVVIAKGYVSARQGIHVRVVPDVTSHIAPKVYSHLQKVKSRPLVSDLHAIECGVLFFFLHG